MSKININKTADIDSIRGVRQNELSQLAKSASTKTPEKAAKSEDKLELSDRAAEVGKLVDQVKQLPDVRQEKVAELRVQIAAGEYQPTDEEIANAIIKDESKA
ncbi:MAG: flagellar biosynthesis anti-sigma factor FlgM [Pyrinomonadaceae bacterium]|nr:flagellar biosynthesis anti-sigma factor FlgM [Pyrinomonadaceae bacterium]